MHTTGYDMSWKDELSTIERSFDRRSKREWGQEMSSVRRLFAEYPSNVEVAIRCIYILHHILLEEEYPEQDHDVMVGMLRQCYVESYPVFSENPEYLFFVGKILFIAEWYFGLDDDVKSMEDRLAFRMESKAFSMEPDNRIYEWGCMLSKGETFRTAALTHEILHGDGGWLSWLQEKGYPGVYVLECLECYRDYGASTDMSKGIVR